MAHRQAPPTSRREFIALGGAVAWPIAARAQQDGRARRVGVLMGLTETDPEGQARVQAFRQGLADLGWAEGRNLRVDVRWAEPDGGRQQSYARELVALAPAGILANSTLLAHAARE